MTERLTERGGGLARAVVTNPPFRPVMWRVSLVTAAFGLTEPIFVPEYWNPPIQRSQRVSHGRARRAC